MATATASAPSTGPIDGSTVYPLDDFMRRAGLGRHAMRAARRQGLKVRRVGNRAYVHGADFHAYLRRQDGEDE